MGAASTLRMMAAGAVLAALLAGCAGEGQRACPAGLKPMIAADLYFGRAIPGGGTVTDTDWQQFVDDEVTPRFPDGLTITDALGQWRGLSGIVQEKTKRLSVMIAGVPAEIAKLDAIRSAYRSQFRQESVLIVETPACGAF